VCRSQKSQKKSLTPLFWEGGFRVIQVIDVNIPKKLVENIYVPISTIFMCESSYIAFSAS